MPSPDRQQPAVRYLPQERLIWVKTTDLAARILPTTKRNSVLTHLRPVDSQAAAALQQRNRLNDNRLHVA